MSDCSLISLYLSILIERGDDEMDGNRLIELGNIAPRMHFFLEFTWYDMIWQMCIVMVT